ncbi:15774_t:CDS:2 [Cetraspora pellucida]|uniref:15774_t:CDS:1 n=1 Tax=Cetraspora pellucida TaxID=1433469 RepID=A0A9N9NEF0_9GLOM|nr:15774_t:CDS:2 [Cetraspora pellucida]
MLKLSLKLLDKRKEGKTNPRAKSELPTSLPAFEWQVTGDSGLGDLVAQRNKVISPPDDAIFGTTNERKIAVKRAPIVNNGRTSNAESSRIRLMQIIENEDARNNFQVYLKSQYCEENLDFYMDVVQYRELFSSEIDIINDVREISSTAKYIWNYYLDSDTSSKPLNVPQDLANQCRQKIDSKMFTKDIFDKLQQHCFDLMVQDSLPKFLRKSVMHENFSSSNSSIPSHLKPPSSAQKPLFGPRRSLSSGSLRAKMASTLATLKTAVSEVNMSSGLQLNSTTTDNQSPKCNKNLISAPIPLLMDQIPRTIMAQENKPTSSFNITVAQENKSNSSVNTILVHENRSNSSFNSTFAHENRSNSSFNITSTNVDPPESNRSSTVSTDSASSSPSTISSFSTNSVSSRLSLAKITRRVLARRRNSASLVSTPKIMEMPGSYPCASVKLRRNMSTSDFQPGSKSHSRMYVTDKTLPPIPAAN